MRLGKPVRCSSRGMRGGRLNDNQIVLPRRVRAYTPNPKWVISLYSKWTIASQRVWVCALITARREEGGARGSARRTLPHSAKGSAGWPDGVGPGQSEGPEPCSLGALMIGAGGAGTGGFATVIGMVCPPHRGWSWPHRPRPSATLRGHEAKGRAKEGNTGKAARPTTDAL
jgi:hypothetical protein